MLKNRSIFQALSIIVMLAIAMPAAAQSSDLDFLKAKISSFLSVFEDSNNVELTGREDYTDEGDYYAVTLPSISLDLDAADLHLGNIAANMISDASSKMISGSFAMPSKLILKVGNSQYPIDIQSQNNKIVWSDSDVSENLFQFEFNGISQNNGGLNDPFVQIEELSGEWSKIGTGLEYVETRAKGFDVQITPANQVATETKSYFINGDSYVAAFSFVPQEDDWISSNLLSDTQKGGIDVSTLKPAYKELESTMVLENLTVSEVADGELFTIDKINSTKNYTVDDKNRMSGQNKLAIDIANSNVLAGTMFPKKLEFTMEYKDIDLDHFPSFVDLGDVSTGQIKPPDFDIASIFKAVKGTKLGVRIKNSQVVLNNGVVVRIKGAFGHASSKPSKSRLGIEIEGWDELAANIQKSVAPQTASQLAQGSQFPAIVALTLAETHGKKKRKKGKTVLSFDLGYHHKTGKWSINGKDL